MLFLRRPCMLQGSRDSYFLHINLGMQPNWGTPLMMLCSRNLALIIKMLRLRDWLLQNLFTQTKSQVEQSRSCRKICIITGSATDRAMPSKHGLCGGSADHSLQIQLASGSPKGWAFPGRVGGGSADALCR